VKSAHDLLHRRLIVEAMNEENIDIRCLQSLQRVFDLIKDRSSRETALVGVIALLRCGGVKPNEIGDVLPDCSVTLRHQDDVLARDLLL
jgi:hypothetical protein